MTDKTDTQREGTDEALMVRYQRGDRNALAVLVRRHARIVYATAYGITGTSSSATELTQSTFLALVEQAGSFHIEMQFRSWLFGLLHQLLVRDRPPSNHAYRTSLAEAPSPEERDVEALPVVPKSGRSQLLSRRISECVASLPLAERELIVMKLAAQLTLAELTIATDTDGEIVRAKLRMALESLRESVSDTEDFARALR